jgi:AraC-like DNA-binding protein
MASPRTASSLDHYLRTTHLTFERAWRHAISGYCGFHQHPVFEIVYHVSGSGQTADALGGSICFVPEAVVLYPPRLNHDQRMKTPGEDLCIHVGADAVPPPELSRSLYVPRLPEAWMRDELINLAARPPEMPPLQRLACHHRTAALFVELIGAAGVEPREPTQPPGDRHASAAREFIRSHYRTMRDVAEAATEAGIGYDHLRHCFRESYGISLKRWHMEVRVDRARDLLRNSNLPLKAIADLCGFRNQRYFSTSFRRLTGHTPGMFRSAGSTD